ncbi:MAG: hypothetical protein F6K56_32700 [Moorea sp. SIO3G5]|nr:hypothetical protein [Moorena sp. SIO3G5]
MVEGHEPEYYQYVISDINHSHDHGGARPSILHNALVQSDSPKETLRARPLVTLRSGSVRKAWPTASASALERSPFGHAT